MIQRDVVVVVVV